MKLIKGALLAVTVLTVAGCSNSQAVNAKKPALNKSARAIVGTSLVGAKGATPLDQDKIDDTAAGLCGAGVWTQSECLKHGK